MPTVSIAKGKGCLTHNDRTIDRVNERSWEPTKSGQNIIYKNENIKQAYERLFGESLKEYNQKQVEKGHQERQIKDYYEHINRSKQEKTFYEIIVAFGNKNDKDNPEIYQKLQECLDEYNLSFQKRNPNLFAFQQITHRDEFGMDHTHIDVVPMATNNTRGLAVKNSMRGALKEMGYTGKTAFLDWRKNEEQYMAHILEKHGLKFEKGDGRDEHLNVAEYQFLQKEVERQAKLKLENMELPEMPKAEIKTNPITKTESIKLSKTDFDEINQVIKHQQIQITSSEARKRALEAQLEKSELKLEKLRKRPTNALYEALKEDYKNLKVENEDLIKQSNGLEIKNKELNKMVKSLEKENESLNESKQSLSKSLETANRREKLWLRNLVNVLAHLPQNIRYNFTTGLPILMKQSLESKVNQKIKGLENERKMKMK